MLLSKAGNHLHEQRRTQGHDASEVHVQSGLLPGSVAASAGVCEGNAVGAQPIDLPAKAAATQTTHAGKHAVSAARMGVAQVCILAWMNVCVRDDWGDAVGANLLSASPATLCTHGTS